METTLDCPKCGTGELTFELFEGENGPDPRDGYCETWTYAILAGGTCGCQFGEDERGRLEVEAAEQAEEVPV